MARGRFARWLITTAVLVLLTAPAAAAELALKRVDLSTGGVGYFEYEAQVQGDATLALDVRLDQVDDVLKSLVVYDGGGTAGEITLPGREPLTQSFADLPFDRNALQSAIGLLNALQGAEVRIAAPKAISGRLVHVDRETETGPGGIVEGRARVSVMTDQGLQTVGLRDVDAISFTDAKLQAQINDALQRIAAYRDSGRRRLMLNLHGSGTRAVRVGYVIAVPLWKPTYRLSLPADPSTQTARLQGWAVLENFSGVAWQGIELTLLTGDPVTFRQALYESYYVPRQTVPVEAGNRVLPPPDTGTVAAETAAKSMPMRMQANAAAAPAGVAGMMPPPPPPVAAPAAPAPIVAANSTEEATQVAFTPPYKIDVAAGQSLVLPLLDRELPARRTDLYQPSVDSRRPLAAIELTNNSGTALPAGVLTLYQQGGQGAMYLGDARLSSLPAGDKRPLSYAVDGKVTVDRSDTEQRPLVKATIAKGVLHINRMIRSTTEYRIKNLGAAASRLLIEQERRGDAKLISPDPKTVELAGDAYRIPFQLPAGQGKLDVVEQEPTEETIGLVDCSDDQLAALVSATELDPNMRQALAQLATRRQTVAEKRTGLDRLKEQRGELVADQKRLRDNLAVLGADPAMHKRILDQFDQTETQIEKLTAPLAAASNALAAAQQDLATYIADLKL